MGFEIGKITRLTLGYVGENDARTINVDVSEWLDKWPGAFISMIVCRPGESALYIAPTTIENGVLSWTISQADVAIAGRGYAQFRASDAETGVQYKSRVVETVIYESIEGGDDEEAPDASQGWVTQVLDAADRITSMHATSNTLSPDQDATATYADGLLTLGIPKGETGVTYTPHMTNDGTLSWTNDGGLDNPNDVNLRGPSGHFPDPTAFSLPVLHLTGDISPIMESKDNVVTVGYTYGDMTGTATLKGQGASSYKEAQRLGEKGKYNYTIKFDQAFEAAAGWGVQKKYCLKANFIDHTHSRNIVSAKLWGQLVKSRETENANLAGLVNGGAVDGFPIVILLNGKFHGLYSLNIPKDGWMMGLTEDASKQQAIVGAEEHTTATQFKGLLAGDGSDFDVEFVSDETNAGWVTDSLNALIQACIDARVATADAVFDQYLDLDSVIDYLIWVVVIKGSDMVDKNYLLSTFDGVKWCFTAYDMDSTYGLAWNGASITDIANNTLMETVLGHRAYELVKRYKTDALRARYAALRADILSEASMVRAFENYAWAIPAPVLMADVERYPAIPGSSVATIDQIGRWVRQRLALVDAWFDKLPAQEVPLVISAQPVSATAAVGDKVSFTVEAVGVASYQWQFSTNGGSTWSDSAATGARTNTLSNYEVTSARLAYKFRCKLTDHDGNIVHTDVVGINAA